jgi:[ribosomal protein S5]-alanine N-acetyltransferase
MLPSLVTPRLALCPATDADLDALWRLLTDPQVRRYLCDDRVLTRAEVQALLAESIAQWPAGMGLWLLRLREGESIGCVGLHPVSPGVAAHAPDLAGEIEPTIALTPEHWGCGYAAEALVAALAHAFATLARDHLVAVVDEPNPRSHRLMMRVGFTPTGITATGPCYPLRTYCLASSAFAASGVPRTFR